MKSISYSLLAAAAAVGLAYGADTATTTPVGYVSLGSGSATIPANTDVSLSIPMVRASEASAVVASVSGSVITFSGTPFTASQFVADSATPYLAIVKTGPEEGLMALISGNTSNSLTVTPVGAGNLAGVVQGNKIQISKAWTLKSFFPATFPAGVRVLAFTGTAVGENLPSNLQYVWNGTDWLQLVGGTGNASNTILYPGESFILRTANASIPQFVVSGEVPTFSSRTVISKLGSGNQDNRVSFFSPVEEVIGNLNLGFNPGDRLLAYNNGTAGTNKPPTEILVWDGTNWQGLLGVQGIQTNTYKLKPGVGYTYRRAANATVGDVDWKADQSYRDNL